MIYQRRRCFIGRFNLSRLHRALAPTATQPRDLNCPIKYGEENLADDANAHTIHVITLCDTAV